MSNNDKNIGHFLTYEIWEDSLRLLNAQIESQESNKHFKTLSMIYYYKKLGNSVEQLKTTEFFEKYVTNNLFYGLESEFAIYPYIVPKSGLGLRKLKNSSVEPETFEHELADDGKSRKQEANSQSFQKL